MRNYYIIGNDYRETNSAMLSIDELNAMRARYYKGVSKTTKEEIAVSALLCWIDAHKQKSTIDKIKKILDKSENSYTAQIFSPLKKYKKSIIPYPAFETLKVYIKYVINEYVDNQIRKDIGDFIITSGFSKTYYYDYDDQDLWIF